ncbi:uncharacterized protein LOC110247415 [Exaiptasia diaphana]|uniref:Uncharacterized protein n=1 Tax=Exaiptasia diaphana TaxID=2652724 RepID=A0A913XTG4_EXADI|nr:uncharacterized protein LOC110247415 [Exaiptasia diaphana]
MDDTSEESKMNETETINALKQTQDNVTLDKQSDLTRNTKKSGTRVFIGRRTGKTIKVNKSFNIADCFPPVEESDEENLSPKEIPKPVEKPAKRKQQAKKAAKRHFIGR